MAQSVNLWLRKHGEFSFYNPCFLFSFFKQGAPSHACNLQAGEAETVGSLELP